MHDLYFLISGVNKEGWIADRQSHTSSFCISLKLSESAACYANLLCLRAQGKLAYMLLPPLTCLVQTCVKECLCSTSTIPESSNQECWVSQVACVCVMSNKGVGR